MGNNVWIECATPCPEALARSTPHTTREERREKREKIDMTEKTENRAEKDEREDMRDGGRKVDKKENRSKRRIWKFAMTRGREI